MEGFTGTSGSRAISQARGDRCRGLTCRPAGKKVDESPLLSDSPCLVISEARPARFWVCVLLRAVPLLVHPTPPRENTHFKWDGGKKPQ